MVNPDWTHFLSTLIWGIYGITVGTFAVSSGYTGPYIWVTIVTAIVGNSAHLVAFAWSKKGFQVSSSSQVKT